MNVDLENSTRDELKELLLELLLRLEVLEQRNKELEAENERLRKEADKKNPPSFVKAPSVPIWMRHLPPEFSEQLHCFGRPPWARLSIPLPATSGPLAPS